MLKSTHLRLGCLRPRRPSSTRCPNMATSAATSPAQRARLGRRQCRMAGTADYRRTGNKAGGTSAVTRRNKEQAAPVHQRRAPPATTKRPSMMLTLPGTHSCPKPVFFKKNKPGNKLLGGIGDEGWPGRHLYLSVRVALKLRSLRFHSPRLCRIAVFLIQTNVCLSPPGRHASFRVFISF